MGGDAFCNGQKQCECSFGKCALDGKCVLNDGSVYLPCKDTWTGGTCWWSGCEEWRGNVFCNGMKQCECKEHHCAVDGKCVENPTMPKESPTGDSNGPQTLGETRPR